jgi:long-chain acyl-CoA synthetase
LVTAGYLNRPEETAETYKDGWVHSGDLGTIGKDGHLRITGRKKELIITAGGKNISPNNIEALIKEHPLIGQVCVVGDEKAYLTALVVLDPEVAPAWAKERGIEATSLPSLATDPTVLEAIDGAIKDANRRLSRVESVKKFTILPTDWTPESGELTPTLKLKRNVIREKYATEIDGLYQ